MSREDVLVALQAIDCPVHDGTVGLYCYAPGTERLLYFCHERIRALAAYRATPQTPAVCTHLSVDARGVCNACGKEVALAVPVEFAKRMAEIEGKRQTPVVDPGVLATALEEIRDYGVTDYGDKNGLRKCAFCYVVQTGHDPFIHAYDLSPELEAWKPNLLPACLRANRALDVFHADAIKCGSCGGVRARGSDQCPHCPPGHDPAQCCRCRPRASTGRAVRPAAREVAHDVLRVIDDADVWDFPCALDDDKCVGMCDDITALVEADRAHLETPGADALAENSALVDRLVASGLHPDDVIRTSSVLMRGRRQGVLAMLRIVDEHLARSTGK